MVTWGQATRSSHRALLLALVSLLQELLTLPLWCLLLADTETRNWRTNAQALSPVLVATPMVLCKVGRALSCLEAVVLVLGPLLVGETAVAVEGAVVARDAASEHSKSQLPSWPRTLSVGTEVVVKGQPKDT